MINPDNHERLMKEDINYKVKYLENQLELIKQFYEETFGRLCKALSNEDPEVIAAAITHQVMVVTRKGRLG